MKFVKYILLITLLSGWMLPSCVEKYDTEPGNTPIYYGTIVDISQLKSLYDDELAKAWYDRTPVKVTGDWAITGIVTGSDKIDGNLYKEGFVEDATSGILLKFVSTGGFYLGDSVIINVKDLYLGDYGDFIQLGDVPYTDASGNVRVSGFNKDKRVIKVSINNPSHPAMATISLIKNDSYLGRLVKLEGVQFSGSELGKTYAEPLEDPPAAANRYLEDCDGKSIIVRSSGYATFADDLLPEGGGSFTGIVTKFNSDYQLVIRDIREIQLDGDRCIFGGTPLGDPVETISEDFESFANNEDIIIDGWQNLMITGNRIWINKIFSSNGYAQATAFGSGLAEMETWLITRPVFISTQKVLSFRSAQAYWTHEPGNQPMEVLFSGDYNGTNFYSATWTPLQVTLANSGDANYAWVSSGDINLPVGSGSNGVVAFRYRGGGSETTSSIVDNITISVAK